MQAVHFEHEVKSLQNYRQQAKSRPTLKKKISLTKVCEEELEEKKIGSGEKAREQVGKSRARNEWMYEWRE